MAARQTQKAYRCCARVTLALVSVLLSTVVFSPRSLFAQTEVSSGPALSTEMKAKLLKPGDLTLRDANFVEAMFAIRRIWGVNVVVGNDLKDETVSCEFSETPLHEILDTLLATRGYAYKPVGNSLVVIRQDAMGAMKPLFQSATIAVLNADPVELKEALTFYLSERGQIQVVASAKRLVVIDYPDRIETIAKRAKELDDAARGVNAQQSRSGVSEAEAAAIANGNAAAGVGETQLGPAADFKIAIFDLRFIKAELASTALQPMLSPLGKISALLKDNRLIVYDGEDKLIAITEAIRQLDIPRSQVRISALIYDASLEDIRRCGVNWNRIGLKGNNTGALGVAQDSVVLDAVTSAVPGAGAANGALAITSLGSNFDLGLVIQALAQSKNSRLLADPNVTVYDQEVAKIEIVTEIPFQQLTQSGQSGPIGTTAFREAGVSLNVTPQINGDTITMLVNPRFSVLTGLTPATNAPIIDRRETSTTVQIRDRETLVIGGLRQKSSIYNRNGIPYLMDMRWPFGELFKAKDTTAKESELVVFITPEILELSNTAKPREHCILESSIPNIDKIPYPAVPLDPCNLEEWVHRCGCEKCQQRKAKHQAKHLEHKAARHAGKETCPPLTTVHESQFTQGYESLPPANVVEPQAPSIDIAPPVNASPNDPFPPPPPRGQETKNKPTLTPVQIQTAKRREAMSKLGADQVATRLPPLPAAKNGPPPTPGMRLPEVAASTPKPQVVQPKTNRLPMVEESEPTRNEPIYSANRLNLRDIFQPLPAVEDSKLR